MQLAEYGSKVIKRREQFIKDIKQDYKANSQKTYREQRRNRSCFTKRVAMKMSFYNKNYRKQKEKTF